MVRIPETGRGPQFPEGGRPHEISKELRGNVEATRAVANKVVLYRNPESESAVDARDPNPGTSEKIARIFFG